MEATLGYLFKKKYGVAVVSATKYGVYIPS
jgi:hypothetical protein